MTSNQCSRLRRARERAGRDDGSTLILTVFFAGLTLTVILLVVATTSLYLERKRLFTVADGAVLAGAGPSTSKRSR